MAETSDTRVETFPAGRGRISLPGSGDVASRLQLGGDVPQRALAIVDRIAV